MTTTMLDPSTGSELTPPCPWCDGVTHGDAPREMCPRCLREYQWVQSTLDARIQDATEAVREAVERHWCVKGDARDLVARRDEATREAKEALAKLEAMARGAW